MKKIYIAGFDVFHEDAKEILNTSKKLCKHFGFKGLSPLDNTIKLTDDKYKDALTIRNANCEMIKECDIIIANCNPFRGFEPDSGTCFEIGYASCLGKKVVLYTQNHKKTQYQALNEYGSIINPRDICMDKEYPSEDFDLSLNLMLACSAEYIGRDFVDCLIYLSE